MTQQTMYTVKTIKPVKTTAEITQTDTQLPVDDIREFPTAPNIVRIKQGTTKWERCKYTAVIPTTGNAGYLTIVRSGAEHGSNENGVAQAWAVGSTVYMSIGEYEMNSVKDNITEHETLLAAAEVMISNHAERLTTAESSISSHGSTLTNYGTRITALEEILDPDVIPYGFLWNTLSSNPVLTRCDQNGDTLLLNGTNFDHHPLWGNIKRCSLTAAGVATYGSDNKGTGLTTTSDYMMVEIPQVHVMEWTDGDYRGFALCNEAFTGKPGAGTEISSSVHPWFNQRAGSLAAPCTKGYVGAYKASNNGGTSLSSKSGVAPLANIDMATFEARGNAIGTNWGITNIHYQSLLQLLMYIEFGTMNIQSALAPGFTKSTNTAPQTCGASDSLMRTNGTGGGTDVQGVNYRGINNPYGDLWEFRIGFNSVNAEYRVLNRDGSGTIAATLATGSYEATSGITPLTGVSGYASGVLNVDPLRLMFMPSAIAGSETTYLCDYFYGHTSGNTGCLLAGGYWPYAGKAGPGCLSAINAVSSVNSNFGARVEFLGVV